MLTLNDYLDLAKKRLALRSDRQLSMRLGCADTIVSQMRRSHMFPADATMIRLAELAGLDPAEALCSLAQWRAQSPEVADYWKKISDLVVAAGKGAAVVLLATGFSLGTPASHGKGLISEQGNIGARHAIHYARNRRWSRSLARRLLALFRNPSLTPAWA